MTADVSDRLKRLHLPWTDVFDVVWPSSPEGDGWPEVYAVVKYFVPTRTKVISVSNDPRTRSFEFILQNDGWPEVPKGPLIPEMVRTGVPSVIRTYYRDQTAPLPELR